MKLPTFTPEAKVEFNKLYRALPKPLQGSAVRIMLVEFWANHPEISLNDRLTVVLEVGREMVQGED